MRDQEANWSGIARKKEVGSQTTERESGKWESRMAYWKRGVVHPPSKIWIFSTFGGNFMATWPKPTRERQYAIVIFCVYPGRITTKRENRKDKRRSQIRGAKIGMGQGLRKEGNKSKWKKGTALAVEQLVAPDLEPLCWIFKIRASFQRFQTGEPRCWVAAGWHQNRRSKATSTNQRDEIVSNVSIRANRQADKTRFLNWGKTGNKPTGRQSRHSTSQI